jgi:iron complex transport system substrate-binding protein
MGMKIHAWLAVILFASALILPALAESFTLKIYGNANMDEAIDDQDISCVQGIIDGKEKSTELADANHDGVVNS